MEERTTIPFIMDDGEEIEFSVLEQTMVNGTNYLLVTEDWDDESDEVEVMILKDNGQGDEEYSSYEIVEDDTEMESVFKVFEELLDENDEDE